ncbi:MAG TPA: NAD-dependent epimerase/dehydratase family protein [Candidatus Nanopelagicales bacterium]
MARHVVVGAGGIGRATARKLAQRGHEVTLASRSGTDPGLEGVRAVAADAADARALASLASGAASLVNAVNPSHYHTWARDWPPVAAAMLSAAETSGAALLTVSNLYGYGPVAAPMTESTPLRPAGTKGELRAGMWRDALAAHEAGRIRASELRASDYFGPGATGRVSMLNAFVIAPAAAGRTVRLITGGPDVPHSWTYLEDIGTLAAVLATDDRAWGRPWHVPTSAPRTVREVVAEVAGLRGHPVPAVTRMPGVMRAVARLSPTVRELDETRYQFDQPFVLDSTQAESTFGLAPTPWHEALAETVTALAPR